MCNRLRYPSISKANKDRAKATKKAKKRKRKIDRIKKEGDILPPSAIYCPVCNILMQRIKHSGRRQYVCPTGGCDMAVGCCPNGQPLGIPASAVVRRARRECHQTFDRLWRGENAIMSRRDAYKYLAGVVGTSSKYAHISRFDLGLCEAIIEKVVEDFPSLKPT